MKKINRYIKQSGLYGFIAVLVFCLATPLQAADHGAVHPTGSHKSEHGGSHQEKPHVEETVHTEHGHEASHVEHATTQTEHGDAHETHASADSHGEHGEHKASSSGGHDAGHGDGHEAAGGHGDAAHGDGHHAPPPLLYYILWGLLLFTFVIVCFRCLWTYKRGKPKHESLMLPFLLVVIAIMLFGLNQLPEVGRHFDPISHQFVDGYHESSGIGFIKFIYKMALGVCLTIYGIMGREDH